jgi:septal ring factor EnvC (AmiA/AmiB activator)
MADTNFLPNSLESIPDQRMTQQSKQLQDLFSRYSKNTQDDLQQVKTSQEFISGKFDEVLKAINELKSDYNLLCDENIMLKQRVNELQNKIAVIDNDCEGLKQYSRRDLLEVHGIPQNLEENTDKA